MILWYSSPDTYSGSYQLLVVVADHTRPVLHTAIGEQITPVVSVVGHPQYQVRHQEARVLDHLRLRFRGGSAAVVGLGALQVAGTLSWKTRRSNMISGTARYLKNFFGMTPIT